MRQSRRVHEVFLCLIVVLGLFLAGVSCAEKRKGSPARHTILIEQMKFNPEQLTVSAGDTVEWINKDIVTHNVTSLPDSAWRSGPLKQGESWKLVVQKGTEYFCSVHQVMKGRLTLK
jgi:plastocyanin